HRGADERRHRPGPGRAVGPAGRRRARPPPPGEPGGGTMKLWLAEAVYRESLPCSRETLEGELLPAHAAYIRAGADRGTVLLAGPKGTGGGGFLVLRAGGRAALDAFLDGDPLVVHG